MTEEIWDTEEVEGQGGEMVFVVVKAKNKKSGLRPVHKVKKYGKKYGKKAGRIALQGAEIVVAGTMLYLFVDTSYARKQVQRNRYNRDRNSNRDRY